MVNRHTSLQSLTEIAAEIERNIVEAGYTDRATTQAMAIAEESGEFVGAYRRWAGLARRSGSFEDMAFELADLVVTAFVTAVVLNIDLPAAIDEKLKIIFSRGWRESTNVTIQPAIESNEARGVE